MSTGAWLAVLVATLTTPAFASGLYVSGQGGVAYLPDLRVDDHGVRSTDSFAAGRILGTAVGYDAGNGWRYEVDWTHQTSELDRFNGSPESGHLWSVGVMANVIYDLTQGTRLTPYVGAGVGVQWIGGSVHGYSGKDRRPAYQLRAGGRFEVAEHTALFAEYRFAQSTALTLSDASSTARHDFAEHAVLVGITFRTGLGSQERLAGIANFLGIGFDDSNVL